MTYRSLLVHLDHDPHCAARTQVAIGLAKRMGCHLVGVAPTGLIELPAVPEAAVVLGDFAARAWDALRAETERLTDIFRDACQAGGVTSCEAVVDEAKKREIRKRIQEKQIEFNLMMERQQSQRRAK